jgi:hypothetical protein
MAERKTFLVRLDPALHEALQRWADADLRSLNAQIEFLLRRAVRDADRMPADRMPADRMPADRMPNRPPDDPGAPSPKE